MVQRWLQQKQVKIKRQKAMRRGVLKQYSTDMVNASRTPNPEAMAMYRNAAHGLGVSMRALAMTNYRYKPTPISHERQAVKDLMKKIEQSCPDLLFYKLVDDSFMRARMYFNHNPPVYLIVEEDFKKKTHKRSIEYRHPEYAYQRWLGDTITWVDDACFRHPRIAKTKPPPDG